MPLRWLAANCGELSAHKFGVAEMANVVDIMDKAFNKVVTDGSKMMNEKFMMDMFSKLTRKIPPFADYLTYMFSENEAIWLGHVQKRSVCYPGKWSDQKCSIQQE